jgi:predicted acylesterase/phospholipase RssA
MDDKITLCLSGGGFRASIFHLGVIDYFAQAHLLGRVQSIYGVSGGAVAAAHLAHNWTEYLDVSLFSKAALTLLERCHAGILDQVVWSSLAFQKNRTFQLAKELNPLFTKEIPSSAKPTYLVFSSLTDTSQFAVDLVSQQLHHLLRGHANTQSLGKVRDALSTSIAVAMSACFPLAFEPVTLDEGLTSVPVKALGREHTVADGGVVDNLGIEMAYAIEQNAGQGHLFVISDAGRLFDDMGSKEAERATMLSPMRTIDYLLNQNAATILARIEPLITQTTGKLAVIRLEDARTATDKLKIDAGLVKAAMDLRTSFDSFSFGEIVTTYRLGIIIAESVLSPLCGQPSRVDFYGLVRGERLDGKPLDTPWKEISIADGSGALGRTIETILRKPGLAILFAGLVLLCAAVAVGIVVRAIIFP